MYVCTHIHTCIHAHARTHARMNTHTHTHAHTHARTHARTHTYRPTNRPTNLHTYIHTHGLKVCDLQLGPLTPTAPPPHSGQGRCGTCTASWSLKAGCWMPSPTQPTSGDSVLPLWKRETTRRVLAEARNFAGLSYVCLQQTW